MKVWVIENGEYENRGVVGVAASPEAAERLIKREYGGRPLEWAGLKLDRPGCFELVRYCEMYPTGDSFSIEEYELAEDLPSTKGSDDLPEAFEAGLFERGLFKY